MRHLRKNVFIISIVSLLALGCDGARFVFVRYTETPVIMAPPAGLSSSDLAAIVAAIR